MALKNDAVLGENPPKYPTIWVRPNSNVQGVGGALTASMLEDGHTVLRAIGAGAVNQAVKSAIQARQHLSAQGEDLVVRPGFVTVQGNDGNDVTAIVFHCVLL